MVHISLLRHGEYDLIMQKACPERSRKGLVRYQQSGCFHFITFGGYHRFQHLGTASAREFFEHSLEAMRIRCDFIVCGYVMRSSSAR